ncbi:MAG: hypothetical protein ABSB70_06815 [Candidatus Velthaea sp.]|jgi:hypothetical protein
MREPPNLDAASDDLGGDIACWLHLVCPSCGAILTASAGHRPECAQADVQPGDV